MSDYIVRGTAANETIRAFAIDNTEMAAESRRRHFTYPVVTAAMGRLMAVSAMMGSMMKGENDKMTATVKGDGPIGQMVVTVDSHGNVKGFPANPSVDIDRKYPGKLDVGGAIGQGTLTISMDLGLKEPYNGQVELQTGEIGDDFAYYFTVSEQTPSAVALGVKINEDTSVKFSGGMIIQLMPNADEETIAALESVLATLPPITTLMEEGKTPEEILNLVLGDLGLIITETLPVRFYCDCSKERVASALATLQSEDIEEMIEDDEDIEVLCHFCNSNYKFSTEELRSILAERKVSAQK